MADANDILRVLTRARKPLSLDEVCERSIGKPAPAGTPERKLVVKCLGRLIGRGLAKALAAEEQTFPQTHGGYEATDDGRSFVKEGRSVAEHVLDYPAVTKPKKGPKANGEAFRAALWAALRHLKRATLPELIEVAGNQGVIKTETLAAAWVKALIRAGVAVEMKRREPGFAPTSNGFKRYALVRDLGVKAPSVSRYFIIDNNSGEQLAFDAPKRATEAA